MLSAVVADGSAVGIGVAFPPLNAANFIAQFFWFSVCFGCLFAFVSLFLVPRIKGIMKLRDDKISADLSKTAQMKEEAGAIAKEAAHLFSVANKEAEDLVSNAREGARAKLDDELKNLESKLASRVSEVEDSLAELRQEKDVKESVALDSAKMIVASLLDDYGSSRNPRL